MDYATDGKHICDLLAMPPFLNGMENAALAYAGCQQNSAFSPGNSKFLRLDCYIGYNQGSYGSSEVQPTEFSFYWLLQSHFPAQVRCINSVSQGSDSCPVEIGTQRPGQTVLVG